MQVAKLIAFKIGQETHEQFRDELTLLTNNNAFDANNMSKIIYEKYGNTTYKYTAYKTDLSETIMQCKQFENLKKNNSSTRKPQQRHELFVC